MRIPVLTYHAVNVDGNDYTSNDHIAFAADLRAIQAAGLRIVPLAYVVDQLLGIRERDLSRCIALTCDDGTDYDYFDLDYPPHGVQRSFFNSMLDFRREFGGAAQPKLHLTSFVIAAPTAREELDAQCLHGRGAMRDTWWRSAATSGLMAIENHSWDHNHPKLTTPGPHGMTRGSFMEVNNRARAEDEIAMATRYINRRLLPIKTTLFCYPFSHVPAYLREDYFPRHKEEHGMLAALADGAQPVTADSDRWCLPRYICGHHWKSPEELVRIFDIAR
jgi:peptidoglycan/xylan/chitin deacetylase (PgdA/CDA1 family)